MFQNPDSVIFDLDGTLWDSSPACARGWNNVLRKNGVAFREIVADDIRSVAGKPHDQCIREIFVALPEAQLRLLIAETQDEDNRMVAQHGGTLYPGVAKGLTLLSERVPLFIVSNCQSGYIENFIETQGFDDLFRDIECWGNTGQPKPDNLRKLIQRNFLKTPVYVGDMIGDQNAARACEIPFIYASYGFGKCTEPQMTISDFSQLGRLFS